MAPVLYHNPRCSKSRQTLALLQEKGVAPQIVEYLKTPPDAATLAELIGKLGIPAKALLRKGEDAYKALGLKDVDDESALIAAMAAHPVLIERPILVNGAKAAIGRPPEAVLDIL